MHPSFDTRWLVALLALSLAACGTVIREARMDVPAELTGVAEESFGKVGWGRSGAFTLGAQQVRYERGADRLSLFETYATGRAPLQVWLSGPSGPREASCTARQSEVTAGVLAVPVRPWTLACQWGRDAQLQISERRLNVATQAREGQYRRGDLTLTLRSVHRLAGSALVQPMPTGYEILHDGRAVGSVDLVRGSPVLRRPDPGTPLGQAVTEAALVLALVWEPQ
jgi:hypothetical protein